MLPDSESGHNGASSSGVLIRCCSPFLRLRCKRKYYYFYKPEPTRLCQVGLLFGSSAHACDTQGRLLPAIPIQYKFLHKCQRGLYMAGTILDAIPGLRGQCVKSISWHELHQVSRHGPTAIMAGL